MIEEIRTNLISARARKEKIESDIEERKTSIKKLNRTLKNTLEAQMILQTVAQQTQTELEYKISEIVTLALNAVFDDPYEFKIVFDIKRGRTEANIKFLKDKNEFDPMSATGGGVLDVASFALRIACWHLQTPRSRNTIILDEPFRFLSADLQSKASEMLKSLSDKLQLQFIIVTHIEEFKENADKIFYVKKIKKVSNVKAS